MGLNGAEIMSSETWIPGSLLRNAEFAHCLSYWSTFKSKQWLFWRFSMPSWRWEHKHELPAPTQFPLHDSFSVSLDRKIQKTQRLYQCIYLPKGNNWPQGWINSKGVLLYCFWDIRNLFNYCHLIPLLFSSVSSTSFWIHSFISTLNLFTSGPWSDHAQGPWIAGMSDTEEKWLETPHLARSASYLLEGCYSKCKTNVAWH